MRCVGVTVPPRKAGVTGEMVSRCECESKGGIPSLAVPEGCFTTLEKSLHLFGFHFLFCETLGRDLLLNKASRLRHFEILKCLTQQLACCKV